MRDRAGGLKIGVAFRGVYGKRKTKPRRKPTPKEFAFCRFD
jgi:hypothetical protein